MTPTPPTLSAEAREFFRKREDETYTLYNNCLKSMPGYASFKRDITPWNEAADLRQSWRLAHADWKRALATTPCTHRVAERSHEAQRCDWCWMLSTYSRLSTPKEDEDDN